MKKITFMMSLLLAMGSMTASAQILDRSGWEISVSGETSSDGGGKNAIIDNKNNTYWHSNWGEMVLLVTLPKNFLSFFK